MKYAVLVALVGFSLCSIASSADQTNKPQTPTDNQTAKGNDASQHVKPNQTKNSEDATVNVASPIADQISDKDGKQATDQLKEDIEIQRKLVRATYCLVGVGILQALILVGQTVAFFRTLKGINRQVGIMQSQTGILGDSVRAARDGADAAKTSADALINIERPWILVRMKPPIQ